jgi:hypothetical protein
MADSGSSANVGRGKTRGGNLRIPMRGAGTKTNRAAAGTRTNTPLTNARGQAKPGVTTRRGVLTRGKRKKG